MPTCPFCDKRAKTVEKEHAWEFEHGKVTTSLIGISCCGQIFFSGPEMQTAEEEIARAIVEAGFQGGDVFRFLRKTLGLPAKDLAALFDVTPETISRWESDERPVPRTARALLDQLVFEHIEEEDGLLKHLKTMRQPARRGRRISV
jgi:DNA-binding transcriptional regulator YiaG